MPSEALLVWIGLANLVLGVAVLGVALMLAYKISRKLMNKTQPHDIDAEVHALVQDHLAQGTEAEEPEHATTDKY